MVQTLQELGDDGASLSLNREMLEASGLQPGDEVEVRWVEGALQIVPSGRYASDEAFDAAAEAVLKKRRNLLERLA